MKLKFHPSNYENFDKKVAKMKRANLEFEEETRKSQEISDEMLDGRFTI